MTGQSEWTYLSVPIAVTALDPVPVLESASLTVSPGASVTYDLKTLTTWQGREDWDAIVYTVDYSGRDFTIKQDGSALTVTGEDAAASGDEEVAVVAVSSHPGVSPARLILRVGAVPSTLPKAGTVAQQCSQADGSSCTIDVIGATGEVNPLPNTPLELVDVRGGGTCTGRDVHGGGCFARARVVEQGHRGSDMHSSLLGARCAGADDRRRPRRPADARSARVPEGARRTRAVGLR
jgi:hypothetical protein